MKFAVMLVLIWLCASAGLALWKVAALDMGWLRFLGGGFLLSMSFGFARRLIT